MKIGILTFHNSRNYGAVMQAYSLVKILTELGFDVEVVNYCCEKIENDLRRNMEEANILKRIFYLKKKKEFDDFNKKNLCLSSRKKIDKSNIKKILSQYDILISGSDQVWNKNITGNDNIYFLKNTTSFKLAYAASCGDHISLNEEELQLINSFHALSVRERALYEFLSERNIPCSVVCDPTILAGTEIYDKFRKKRLNRKKYVFVFMIWKSSKLINIAKRFAESKGLELISNKDCPKFLLYSKPEHFISWIANAEYVFTNSFHGTIFSLLFEKVFFSSVVRPDNKINIRIKELLQDVGCASNIIEDEDINLVEITPLDYKLINQKMKNIREASKEFLRNSLNNIIE